MWNPSFLVVKEKVYVSDNDLVRGEKTNDMQFHSSDEEEEEGKFVASEVKGVAGTVFGDNSVASMNHKPNTDDQQSANPFEIYELLNHKKTNVGMKDSSQSLSHSMGFTPLGSEDGMIRNQTNRENGDIMNNESSPKIGAKVMNKCDSLGSSGGILCIWEETFFRKEHVTNSDYFVAIYGSWVLNKAKILLVAIYAPQDPNEVRSSDERRGLCFNSFNARIFDNFISSSSLVDVKMEGYSFTWSHPSANKMSKLDRLDFVSTKRSISDEMRDIDKRLDAGGVSDSLLFRRNDLKCQLHDIKSMEAMDSMQKSKVKWAVDFAKAYDSVRWDFLIDVLEAFGFGTTWCNWVRGTFCFVKGLILVNRSPSNEFQFHCRLKQGDPLSPYLFILMMESLHISVCRAVNERLFNGIRLHGSLSLSHLFYADDALFIGEWSDVNLCGIIQILKCFHLASRLHINLIKSQLLGVGVPRAAVEAMAISIDDSLWFRVIKVIHGSRIDSKSIHSSSLWSSILKEVHVIKDRGFDFLEKCSKPVGNGSNTYFWLDAGKETNCVLEASFRRPVRGGVEKDQLNGLVEILDTVSLSPSLDRWVCSLSSDGDFSVKDARTNFDDMFLPSYNDFTRWVNGVPIKINIFAWRAQRDCLPTRLNLIHKGVTLETASCPICLAGEEDAFHVFFQCPLAQAVLRRICRWWEVVWQQWTSFSEWLAWFSDIRLASKVKSLL
nr:RNA-directed DNA polymerase, eukaryota [Tanacetum cinerariifolium]